MRLLVTLGIWLFPLAIVSESEQTHPYTFGLMMIWMLLGGVLVFQQIIRD